MKTPREKQKFFTQEMKKLKKKGQLREEKRSFFEVLKKAIKPQSSSR